MRASSSTTTMRSGRALAVRVHLTDSKFVTAAILRGFTHGGSGKSDPLLHLLRALRFSSVTWDTAARKCDRSCRIAATLQALPNRESRVLMQSGSFLHVLTAAAVLASGRSWRQRRRCRLPQDVLTLSASAAVEVQYDVISMTLSDHARGQPMRRRCRAQLRQALDAALTEARKAQRPGQLDVRTGDVLALRRAMRTEARDHRLAGHGRAGGRRARHGGDRAAGRAHARP